MMTSIERTGSTINLLNKKPRTTKTELDKDDFLSLMITQLKNQDPLSPMNNNEFINQTTQFSSLEQLINIAKSIENQNKVSKESQLYNGAAFLGKNVKFYGNSFNLKDGEAKIQFTLDNSAESVSVSIYNTAGSLVANGEFNNLPAGLNTIPWDGTGLNGGKLSDGSYSYVVKAKDKDGNEIPVRNIANGKVIGAAFVDGKLVFNVNGFSVNAEDITEIYENN